MRIGTIILISVFACFYSSKTIAQPPTRLTINEVYEYARRNYPLSQQRGLIDKTAAYSVSNAAKGYYPALSVSGQASYQSTVTTLPFNFPVAGIGLPQYNRDQYKVYSEVDQVIYEGGLIKNQKQTAEVNRGIQQQNLNIALYALYDRVNQLFFGVLLINEQLQQNNLLKQDIQNGINKVSAMVANGTAYRSSLDELDTQLLQADERDIELGLAKKAYLLMLGLFINRKLDDNTVLVKPPVPVMQDEVTRPELSLYRQQKSVYDLQEQLLKIQLRPRLSAFLQGGYGRPGLNPLSNNFQWFYIGGVRLNWNLSSLYTFNGQRKLLEIGKKTLDVEQETFLFNTSLVQRQQITDIQKYSELFKKDTAIINLREAVKKAAMAQLENGVLSAHDYIAQIIAADQARQNLVLHQVQLLQQQYNYQNTTGSIGLESPYK